MKNLNPNTSPEYAKLPRPLKTLYSEKEYCWLSEREKGQLEERECMPDWMEDE